eukprot:GHUV01038739.1.p2 GENE.GHUV01038739.1~~GHUV01038739.1.p2  ORF type:complete len:119 (-),score=17.48 GHUV01038739.1:169-525(-)
MCWLASNTPRAGLLVLAASMQDGSVELPAITFTESSEALLSGRKPPFRLVARAKQTQESNLQIKHAVSEPFVVATRRVKANKKVRAICYADHQMLCTTQWTCCCRLSFLLATPTTRQA